MAREKGQAQVERQAQGLRRLKVEYVDPETLSPNTYNANRQSEREFELLLRSMKDDGFTQPVIVHKESRQIVDGEHRWRAAKELGLRKIPVAFVEMTAEQMRISTLRHNRARGEEDFELSSEVLQDLQELGAIEYAQDALMLDDKDLEMILQDTTAPDALAGDEYSEAWEPIAGPKEHRDRQLSATPEATKAMEAAEQEVRDAKTEEERVEAHRRARSRQDLYRLTVVFHGEEAELVQEKLGDDPAVRVVELCRKALEDEQ